MIRLQPRESGPYSAAFSLHIPDMRAGIVKNLSSLSRLFAIEHLSPTGCRMNVRGRRSARSDG